MINGNEKICVQGITGKAGSYHACKMLEYGSNVLCGVSRNNNIKLIHNVPVYQTMKEAVKKHEVDTSIIFIPAKFVLDAAFEAIEAGIKRIIIITEHVPIHDSLKILNEAKKRHVEIIGPNCPGVILTDKSKIGIMPESAFKSGNIAIISRSGTLMYEVANYVSLYSTGVKIGIGLGGDPIIGTNVEDAFDYIMENKINKVIVIGEVGGKDEVIGIENAIKKGYNGDIKVFFAGKSAPKGKQMGHAGAIVNSYEESIEYKEEYLKQKGILVAKQLSELV